MPRRRVTAVDLRPRAGVGVGLGVGVGIGVGIEKETAIAGSINSIPIPIPTPTAIPKFKSMAVVPADTVLGSDGAESIRDCRQPL
jgi:hypothetical protein